MSDESIQATAENLRADFLNATTTHQRWKVLNRAIEWAVAASENADLLRQKAQAKEHTVTLSVDSAKVSDDLIARVHEAIRRTEAEAPAPALGGSARGPGGFSLVGEKVEGEEHPQFFGQTFDDPLIVNSVTHPDDTRQEPCDALTNVDGCTLSAGDVVTWNGEEEGWVVRHVFRNGTAAIVPLGDDGALGEQVVDAEDLWS